MCTPAPAWAYQRSTHQSASSLSCIYIPKTLSGICCPFHNSQRCTSLLSVNWCKLQVPVWNCADWGLSIGPSIHLMGTSRSSELLSLTGKGREATAVLLYGTVSRLQTCGGDMDLPMSSSPAPKTEAVYIQQPVKSLLHTNFN